MAGGPTDAFDEDRYFQWLADLDRPRCDAEITKLLHGAARVSRIPRHDQVRPEGDDAFEVQPKRITDARNVFCCCRVIAELDCRYQLLAGSGGINALGEVGGER